MIYGLTNYRAQRVALGTITVSDSECRPIDKRNPVTNVGDTNWKGTLGYMLVRNVTPLPCNAYGQCIWALSTVTRFGYTCMHSWSSVMDRPSVNSNLTYSGMTATDYIADIKCNTQDV